MACTIDMGLNGVAQDAIGLPTRFEVYARVQGQCSRVRFTLRLADGQPVLFSGEADTDSNGTAWIEFPLAQPAFPCGFRFWLRAECVDGSCSNEAFVRISCKRPAPGSGVPGGEDGTDDSSGGWPWPLPPQLFCPLMGRAFTMALLGALSLILISVATNIAGGVAAGLALLVGTFALLAIWRTWCGVNTCYFWGAVLWVLKRVVVGGLILAFATASVKTALLAVAFGAMAGAVTARLRASRCTLPALTTPLQQLPLW